MMVDLAHLRESYQGSFIQQDDYYQLYGIDKSTFEERKDGGWDQYIYQTPHLTYQGMRRSDFLRETFIRVDTLDIPTTPPLPTTLLPQYFDMELVTSTMHAYYDQVSDPTRVRKPLKLPKFFNNLPSTVRKSINGMLAVATEAGEGTQGIVEGEGMMGYVQGLDGKVEILRRWLEVMAQDPACPFVVLRTYEDR